MHSKLQSRCAKNSKRNARVLVNLFSYEKKRKHGWGEELNCDQWDPTRLKIFSDGSLEDFNSGRVVQRKLRHNRSQVNTKQKGGDLRLGRKPSTPTNSDMGWKHKENVAPHGRARDDSRSNSNLRPQRSSHSSFMKSARCAGAEDLAGGVDIPKGDPAWGQSYNGIITSVCGTPVMRKIGMPTLLLQYTIKPNQQYQEWCTNQAILYAKVAAVRMKFNGLEFYALICQRPCDRYRAEALILGRCSAPDTHLWAKDSLEAVQMNLEAIQMNPGQVEVGNEFRMELLGIVRDFQDGLSAILLHMKILRDIKKMGVLLASLTPTASSTRGWMRPQRPWNDYIVQPVKSSWIDVLDNEQKSAMVALVAQADSHYPNPATRVESTEQDLVAKFGVTGQQARHFYAWVNRGGSLMANKSS